MLYYGGQTIFQNMHVQKLCMPRIMFIITDLIRNEKKDAALNHIRFWLRSIKTHAVSERSDGDSADLSFRQAPVVLISTQFIRKAWTMMASQIL